MNFGFESSMSPLSKYSLNVRLFDFGQMCFIYRACKILHVFQLKFPDKPNKIIAIKSFDTHI